MTSSGIDCFSGLADRVLLLLGSCEGDDAGGRSDAAPAAVLLVLRVRWRFESRFGDGRAVSCWKVVGITPCTHQYKCDQLKLSHGLGAQPGLTIRIRFAASRSDSDGSPSAPLLFRASACSCSCIRCSSSSIISGGSIPCLY